MAKKRPHRLIPKSPVPKSTFDRNPTGGLPQEADVVARLLAQGKRPHSLPSLEEAFGIPVERARDFARMMRRLEEAGKVRRVKGRKYVGVQPLEGRPERAEREPRRGRYPGHSSEGDRPRAEEGVIKGRLVKQGGFHFLQPLRAEPGKLSEDSVLIPKRNLGKAQAGDHVTVRLLEEVGSPGTELEFAL